MRKILSNILLIMMTFSLVACGSAGTNVEEKENVAIETQATSVTETKDNSSEAVNEETQPLESVSTEIASTETVPAPTYKPKETLDVAAYIKSELGATYYNTEAEAKAALYAAVKNNDSSVYVAWSGNDNLYKEIIKERLIYDSYAEYVLRAGPTTSLSYLLNGQKIVTIKCVISSQNGTNAQQVQATQEIKNFVNTLKGKTKYEQIRDAYEWTYNIATYDHSQSVHSGQSIYSAVIAKKTVCAGYAKTFQYIMEELGIPCKIVTGANPSKGIPSTMTQEEYEKHEKTYVPSSESNFAGHAWNLVQLDGTWYYIDATQSRYLGTEEKVPTPFLSRFLFGKDSISYKKLEDIIKIADTSYRGDDFANLVEKDTREKSGDDYTGIIHLSESEVYYFKNGKIVSKDEFYDNKDDSNTNDTSESSSTSESNSTNELNNTSESQSIGESNSAN